MSLSIFKISRRHLVAVSLTGLALLASGCATSVAPVGITDTIAKTPSLSTLSGLIAQAGLGETLNGSGPFTVFAPNDEAFKALPAKTLDELAHNPARLKEVLSYHVINGKSLAADIKNSQATSLNGAVLELSKAGDFVTVESGAVGSADILASNGVVHVIDTVLIPPVKK